MKLYYHINITDVSYIRSIIYIKLYYLYIYIYCHGLVLESKPFMTHFASRSPASGPAVPAVLAVDFAEEAKHGVTGCKG